MNLLTLLVTAVALSNGAEDSKLVWCRTLAEACAAAEVEWKPILVEGTRAACGNCAEMAKTVFVDSNVHALLARDFVCLRVDVDDPHDDVVKLLNKVEGDTLPLIAYVTADRQFIRGTSGFRDVASFAADLKSVLSSSRLVPTTADEAKLAKGVAAARSEVDARRHSAASRRAVDLLKIPGRCEARGRLRAILAEIDDVARRSLDRCVELARGDDLEDAIALARQTQREFKGTAHEKSATFAVKCIARLQSAAMEVSRGEGPAARHDYQLLASEAKGSAYAAIAEEKLKALGP